MSLIQWDPWQELDRLRAQTDRMWDEFLEKLTLSETQPEQISFLPDVDLIESPREYRIYLSVPGLVEEDIDLTIAEHVVTVRGQREPPYDPMRARRRLREWRYGYFERRIQLPHVIEPDAVRASYADGVLTITLPKA